MKPNYIHLGGKLDPATLEAIADIICGDIPEKFPVYRSSMHLTKFFRDAGINATHDGTTRKWWVLGVLESLQPHETEKVILRLADLREYKGDIDQLKLAIKALNSALLIDGYKIQYANDKPTIQFANRTIMEESLFTENIESEEANFLSKKYDDNIKFDKLNLDSQFAEIAASRTEEIKLCLSSSIPLGCIFLIGSTLEGILLNFAINHRNVFAEYEQAPKNKRRESQGITQMATI